MQNRSEPKRGIFTATVRANRQIGRRFHRLRLEFYGPAAEVFARCQPGQFVQIDLSTAALPDEKAVPAELVDAAARNILLRRPFSFADLSAGKQATSAEILYCTVGPASIRMTTLAPGDSVSVIGPLGRGFSVPRDKTTALLVAGGMGAGPLLHLAKFLTTEHPTMQATAFAGAKAVNDLPFEKKLDEIAQGLGFSLAEFANYGMESLVATDDGSAGYEGPVTECLADWLGRSNIKTDQTIIYTCGPEPMLARVAEIAAQRNIDCQVSMERMMACGIGVCQSCAVECRTADQAETVYKLCCEDGPVFDAREVVFVSH